MNSALPPKGLSIHDCTFAPAKGDWWASKSPLGLIQIEDVHSDCTTVCTTVTWQQWGPTGIEPMMVVWPAFQGKITRLWVDRVFTLDNLRSDLIREYWGGLSPGDVFVDQDSHRVWFVGPETTETKIHILADWNVPEDAIVVSTRVQEGPPVDRDTLSRFARLSRPEKPNGER